MIDILDSPEKSVMGDETNEDCESAFMIQCTCVCVSVNDVLLPAPLSNFMKQYP